MSSTTKIDAQRAQIINAATELFWRKGYDGVSVNDLVDATGLNRYALYQSFGGKRDLYIASLEAYIAGAKAAMAKSLSVPGRHPMEGMFDGIVEHLLDPAIFPAGCLICTTAVDVAAVDEGVAAIMEATKAEFTAVLEGAYQHAQGEGLAPKAGNPAAFAELAHALYFSIGVQARMGCTREELVTGLRAIVDGARDL